MRSNQSTCFALARTPNYSKKARSDKIVGFNVIQTASWGDANSLKYCFEGLAEHSVTAVCGIGHDHCPQARHLWQYALKELVAEKSPTKLIVYGGKQDSIPELGIPVVYIEDFITKRFRK